MTTTEPNPLTDLLVDEGEVAHEKLAVALKPYVRLTGSGQLVPEPAFDGLSTIRKVCCVLLAVRAGQLLGVRDRPGAAPQEVVDLSGMPPGTVRPKLRELARNRVVVKQNGDYLIPEHALRRAEDLVGGEE